MAPLLVFGAVIVIAGLYVAYVLWPRWPDAPVALDAPSVPIVISGTVFNIEPAAIRRDLDIFRLAQCRRFGAARPISVMVFNTTMQRSVRVHAAGIAAPADLTARANSGFGDFDEMCVECHSAPGMERGEAGKGLNPRPPRLVNAARRWSPSELFWIVKNGIKMTGMPAFGPTHDDDTLWAIVAFVQQLSSLSPEQYKSMRLTNDAALKARDHSDEQNHSDSHR